MAFSSPTAPLTREACLRTHIPADVLRLLLAVAFAAGATSLGVAGLLITTAPRWLAMLVQPCSLLLFPGYLSESFDKNVHSFSGSSVLWVSAAFYFCVGLLILFPSSRDHHRRDLQP